MSILSVSFLGDVLGICTLGGWLWLMSCFLNSYMLLYITVHFTLSPALKKSKIKKTKNKQMAN